MLGEHRRYQTGSLVGGGEVGLEVAATELPASASPASRLLRECTTTVIPSAANRLAVASPIPEVDPVTNATAPVCTGPD